MKKDLGEVVMIQGQTFAFTNKMHLNAINRKKDTLCSKDFVTPCSDTEPIYFKDGNVYRDHSIVDTSVMCQKCIKVFLKNQTDKLKYNAKWHKQIGER